MKCAHCNSKVFNYDRVCPRCGAPVKDASFSIGSHLQHLEYAEVGGTIKSIDSVKNTALIMLDKPFITDVGNKQMIYTYNVELSRCEVDR